MSRRSTDAWSDRALESARLRNTIDTSLARVSHIASEHTRREKPFDPEARYPRGTKPHHFSLNPKNPDAPYHLRAVRVGYYQDPPESNGQQVRYDTFENGESGEGEPQWYEIDYTGGSDYSGGSVTQANYRELQKLLAEHHPDESGQPVVWVDAYGGHGTYGLFVV